MKGKIEKTFGRYVCRFSFTQVLLRLGQSDVISKSFHLSFERLLQFWEVGFRISFALQCAAPFQTNSWLWSATTAIIATIWRQTLESVDTLPEAVWTVSPKKPDLKRNLIGNQICLQSKHVHSREIKPQNVHSSLRTVDSNRVSKLPSVRCEVKQGHKNSFFFSFYPIQDKNLVLLLQTISFSFHIHLEDLRKATVKRQTGQVQTVQTGFSQVRNTRQQ